MKKYQKLTGFTVIEVSLVLAIAGLIFLMVFVALPGLRASQRDTERRESITSFLDNVKKYQTNNRGALPGLSDTSAINSGNFIVDYYADVQNIDSNSKNTHWSGFYKNYLGDRFVDPSGEYYKIKVVNCGVDTANAACTTDLSSATFPNDYTLLVVLQSKCSGDKPIRTSNPRKLSVLYKLEGAGVYCNNS